MVRAIDTPRRKIEQIAGHGDNFGRIIRASLAENYDGIGRTVRVRMGRTPNAPTVQAKISSLAPTASYMPEGTPVSLKFHRGQPEVIAFGLAVAAKVLTLLEKTGASQSVGSNITSPEKVTFSSAQVVTDTLSLFDDTNDKITVPFDGYYKIWAYSGWDSAKYSRRLYIYLNGASRWMVTMGAATDASGGFTNQAAGQSFFTEALLSADDYIELWVSQNSSAALVINQAVLGIELVL